MKPYFFEKRLMCCLSCSKKEVLLCGLFLLFNFQSLSSSFFFFFFFFFCLFLTLCVERMNSARLDSVRYTVVCLGLIGLTCGLLLGNLDTISELVGNVNFSTLPGF